MKKIKCILYANTRNGYNLKPRKFESIREATKEAKETPAFYYYITDEAGNVKKRGFCNP